MSVHSAILDHVVSVISGLSLTLDTVTVLVSAARKTPEVLAGLDSPPLIQVACHRSGGQSRRWDTGSAGGVSRRLMTYLVSISVEVAGNRDPRTNLDTITDWRQQVLRALSEPAQFATASLGSSAVYEVEHEPEGAFDPSAAADNWDSSPLTLRVQVIEPATGT